jgi:hypothetical protein
MVTTSDSWLAKSYTKLSPCLQLAFSGSYCLPRVPSHYLVLLAFPPSLRSEIVTILWFA